MMEKKVRKWKKRGNIRCGEKSREDEERKKERIRKTGSREEVGGEVSAIFIRKQH